MSGTPKPPLKAGDDEDPKWLPWVTIALMAVVAIGFANHFLGIIEGKIDSVLMGCAILAFGGVFLACGMFGKNFTWGEDGTGPPMPRELGATIFTGFGVTMIALGVAALLGMIEVN